MKNVGANYHTPPEMDLKNERIVCIYIEFCGSILQPGSAGNAISGVGIPADTNCRHFTHVLTHVLPQAAAFTLHRVLPMIRRTAKTCQ